MRNALISLILFSLAGAAQADAKARLEAFVDSTKGLKANFTQTVIDRAGRKTQEASGNLYFSRPGKFRWIYQKPYAQVIVGDGKKLWIHDEDLDQVSVRKLDQALGDSPAALLAGDNNIEKLFALKDGGIKDGIEWLEATPKSKEGSFEKVRMGFKGDDLQVMELKDNFGQTTLLRFSNLQRNPPMGANLFRFTPPKGADIIGDR
ncbi:MAG: outer membrane lipoprotein carrier protein LolA [Hydrogenophilales bacterium 28-61-23]|nr:MAG: outer membrane lipoprotein carrier protein LolA [Hydrogenophilales bacterium 28-61-23]